MWTIDIIICLAKPLMPYMPFNTDCQFKILEMGWESDAFNVLRLSKELTLMDILGECTYLI